MEKKLIVCCVCAKCKVFFFDRHDRYSTKRNMNAIIEDMMMMTTAWLWQKNQKKNTKRKKTKYAKSTFLFFLVEILMK